MEYDESLRKTLRDADSLRAMLAKWSVRRSVAAKLAADRSTPSGNRAAISAEARALSAESVRPRLAPRGNRGGSSRGRTTDSTPNLLGSNPRSLERQVRALPLSELVSAKWWLFAGSKRYHPFCLGREPASNADAAIGSAQTLSRLRQ